MASPSKLRRSGRTSKPIARLSTNDAALKKPAAKRKTAVGTAKTTAPPAPPRKTTVGGAKTTTVKTISTPSKTATSAVKVTTKGADTEKSEKEKTVKGPPNNAARRATRTVKNDEKKEDEKKAAPSTVRRGPFKAYSDEPKIAAAATAGGCQFGNSIFGRRHFGKCISASDVSATGRNSVGCCPRTMG